MHTLFLFAVALFTLPAALADFSGDYRMVTSAGGSGQSRTMNGRIMAKPDAKKMRIDMELPQVGRMTNIVDSAAQKSYSVMHTQRTIMETDSSSWVRENNGQCMNVSNVDGCLTQMGFRKSGTETVNSFNCDIFEKSETRDGGTAVTKFYHPHGRTDAPIVRMIMSHSRGSTQMDILNLRFDTVAASEFTLPAGYSRINTASLMGAPGADGKARPDRAAMMRMMQEQMAKMGEGKSDSKRPRRGH